MVSQFYKTLQALDHSGRFVIALSGGVDSRVLLSLAHEYRKHRQQSAAPIKLHAIHVNHQLTPQANDWALYCESICSNLDISCEVLTVTITDTAGESLEAQARDARYHAFSQRLLPNDCLLLAQHQDDQAETFLLQLMRGAGPAGLSSMPRQSKLNDVLMVRPLLSVPRSDILKYAKQEKLEWIEDPSNQDTRFDRNFIRHAIQPEFQKRWPSASATISRAASHCAEQQSLCEVLAAQDIVTTRNDNDSLSIEKLSIFDQSRIKNIIRYWVTKTGLRQPSTIVLERILDELVFGRADAKAIVAWSDGRFQRYRDQLFFLQSELFNGSAHSLEWDGTHPLQLPSQGGLLTAIPSTGRGVKAEVLTNGTAHIHFRCGGERIRLYKQGQTRSLKNLFQENGLPPWERNRIPLLSVGTELVAIGDWLLAEHYTAVKDEPGFQLQWERQRLSAIIPQ